MPPDQPGQAHFLKAQATKGREEPGYSEALKRRKNNPPWVVVPSSQPLRDVSGNARR
jgi:hypothetical protein